MCALEKIFYLLKEYLYYETNKMCIKMNINKGLATPQTQTGRNTNHTTIIHIFHNKLDRIVKNEIKILIKINV